MWLWSPRPLSECTSGAPFTTRPPSNFPICGPPGAPTFAYATTNRQTVVQSLAETCDLILVVGSDNSSNTQALVRVADDLGTSAHRIDRASDILPEWLEGVEIVGLTAGASAPEHLGAGSDRRVGAPPGVRTGPRH